jgi:uncharacterized protein
VTADADLSALWFAAAGQFRLGADSLHGPRHWKAVERNALLLAESTGADVLVVRLFAVLHDCKRFSEGRDPDHGPRAAEFAATVRGTHFELDDARFALLTEACAWHDRGRVSGDPTIGTCWDADRLDLVRVGVTPVASLMSTEAGKRAVGLGGRQS